MSPSENRREGHFEGSLVVSGRRTERGALGLRICTYDDIRAILGHFSRKLRSLLEQYAGVARAVKGQFGSIIRVTPGHFGSNMTAIPGHLERNFRALLRQSQVALSAILDHCQGTPRGQKRIFSLGVVQKRGAAHERKNHSFPQWAAGRGSPVPKALGVYWDPRDVGKIERARADPGAVPQRTT